MTSPLETTLLLTDQQRSVLHTVNAQAHKPVAYTAYGHRPAESGMTCLLGFNGEPPDPVTGHYLLGNGYRAFNPVLMRFNSPDSLSPFGKGGLNGYAYCGGDPVNYQDPTGHTPAFLKSALRRLGVMKPSAALEKTQRYQKYFTPNNGTIKDIKFLAPDIVAFGSKNNTNSTLTIMGHGNEIASNGTHSLLTNNKWVSPDDLNSLLNQSQLNPQDFKRIKLVMCYSASGDGNSFAKAFSDLTGKPVKGYKGTVDALPFFSDIRLNQQNGTYYYNKQLTVFKKNPYRSTSAAHSGFQYEPVTFRSGNR
jgi:RHS repeat-associated protein